MMTSADNRDSSGVLDLAESIQQSLTWFNGALSSTRKISIESVNIPKQLHINDCWNKLYGDSSFPNFFAKEHKMEDLLLGYDVIYSTLPNGESDAITGYSSSRDRSVFFVLTGDDLPNFSKLKDVCLLAVKTLLVCYEPEDVIPPSQIVRDWPQIAAAISAYEKGHIQVKPNLCNWFEFLFRAFREVGYKSAVKIISLSETESDRFVHRQLKLGICEASIKALEHLASLATNTIKPKKRSAKKRRKKRVSSALTPRQVEVHKLIHNRGLTPQEAALELDCSPQNISQILKKAEAKANAIRSRSINLSRASQIPTDKREQDSISAADDRLH